MLFAVTFAAALGCALVGGIFFAFSNFVMRALARVPGGMAAMQAINVTVLNPLFLALFFGTAAACAVLLFLRPGSALAIGGALVYLIGSFGVTMAFNVPRNNALARLDPTGSEPAWRRYVQEWTWWNHIRTLAAALAAALFMLELSQLKT